MIFHYLFLDKFPSFVAKILNSNHISGCNIQEKCQCLACFLLLVQNRAGRRKRIVLSAC